MSYANKHFAIFLFVTLLVASLIPIVPFFTEQDLTSIVIITLVTTTTLLGAVWYFLSSLHAFKPGLKVAYYLLASGIVFYSLVLVQFFLVLFAGVEDVFLRNILFLMPYGLGLLLAYAGMNRFAALLEIKKWWTSVWFTTIVAIGAALIATQLPYPAALVEGIDELTLGLIVAVLTASTVFGLSATAVALRVRRTISTTYKTPTLLVALALLTLALSALHELIVKVYFFESDYALSGLSTWPFLLNGILFLRAGLAFKETQRSTLQLPPNASYTEVVKATVRLVSKPDAVRNEITTLQGIISRTPNSSKLSPQDRTTLRQLYLYLEEYLVTREPLMKFHRESLRENLPKEFATGLGHQIGSDVFRSRDGAI